MTRSDVLTRAGQCVNGDREQDYGTPENSFRVIAAMWNAYFMGQGWETNIGADDVAAMLSLLKLARISTGHAKEDNWVDLAGYAACGGEIQSELFTT